MSVVFPFVVAIDGPAGSGKSSVSKEVARRLGFGFLDTGASYRALAWHVEASGVETDDAASVAWQLLGMIDGLNAHALVRWEDADDRGSRIGHAVEGMLGLGRGALAAS